MGTETATPRAPRLTENRLADLEICTQALQSEISYLAEAYPAYGADHPLHKSLKDRHDALVRGHAWTTGKVAAERGQRAESTEGADA